MAQRGKTPADRQHPAVDLDAIIAHCGTTAEDAVIDRLGDFA